MLRIRELRAEKGVYQKDLAKLLNLANQTISGYETGRSEPSIEALIQMADYFQCSVDELLGREDYGTGNVVIQGAQLSAFDERLLQVVHMLTLEDQYQVLGFAQALAK